MKPIESRKVYLKSSEYFNLSRKPKHSDYDTADVYVEEETGVPSESGSLHIFTLSQLSTTSDKVEIKENIERIVQVSDSVSIDRFLFKGLTETVEGQEILEYVVANNTNWNKYLDLSQPQYPRYVCDYIIKEKTSESENKGNWCSDTYLQTRKENDPMEMNMEIPTEECTYVIRLEDEDGIEWIYVGETENLLRRLGNHRSKGGDSPTLSHKDMRVCKLEEVRVNGDEGEHYEDVVESYEIPSERIKGGK